MLLILVCLTLAVRGIAQSAWSVSGGVDLQSRYVWRGQPLGGNAPCIEPGVAVSWRGLSLGVWGAYGFALNEYQEFDWTLGYTFGDDLITIQVTDYSFPTLHTDYHYFDYHANTTDHVLEAGLIFNVPKTNLSLSAYTNFFGNDARKDNGKLVYSTYVEASYTQPIKKIDTDLSFALGAAVNGKGDATFYGNDGFDIVNISAEIRHAFPLGQRFEIPLYLQLIANPTANKMYAVVGCAITF
ncbi:MAG: hypothetical protein Q4D33_00355 [Prevotellaceae bacterium]|nr:hypothetical protein [Prevotellaceae bacterium]